MDIDVASFMMLSQDLPMLLGSIIRPDNRKVRIRDFEGFEDWLYVISDLIVVGIFAGETNVEKELTKIGILEAFKTSFGITSTSNASSLILSKNQVNVSTIVMTKALHISGAKICKVEFFGMKMPIRIAKPLIDNLVRRYLESLTEELEPQILHHKSIFDIGVVKPTERLELYSFDIEQRRAWKYREGQVHKMCNQVKS